MARSTISFVARSANEAVPCASEIMMLIPAARAAGSVAALVISDLPKRDEIVRRQPERGIRIHDARLEDASRKPANEAWRRHERVRGRRHRWVVAHRHVLPVLGDV